MNISKHFLKNYGSKEFGGIRTFLAQKIRKEEMTKIHNDFELYQVFMHIIYYSQRRIDTFWPGGISSICGINTF